MVLKFNKISKLTAVFGVAIACSSTTAFAALDLSSGETFMSDFLGFVTGTFANLTAALALSYYVYKGWFAQERSNVFFPIAMVFFLFILIKNAETIFKTLGGS